MTPRPIEEIEREIRIKTLKEVHDAGFTDKSVFDFRASIQFVINELGKLDKSISDDMLRKKLAPKTVEKEGSVVRSELLQLWEDYLKYIESLGYEEIKASMPWAYTQTTQETTILSRPKERPTALGFISWLKEVSK